MSHARQENSQFKQLAPDIYDAVLAWPGLPARWASTSSCSSW